MKKLSLIVLLALASCAVNPLKHVDTTGLIYRDGNIYYNNELCATLSAIEMAYDDGKIVKEATFVLTSFKYNEKALSIIKLVKNARPSMEVEVELKSPLLK